MKPIIWLRAMWVSFQVSQAAQRLVFLQDLANRWGEDHDITPEERVTLATYRNVVLRFLGKQDLYSNVWDLDRARELHRKARHLIEIGEMLIYGDDQTETVVAKAGEPGNRAAERRAQEAQGS